MMNSINKKNITIAIQFFLLFLQILLLLVVYLEMPNMYSSFMTLFYFSYIFSVASTFFSLVSFIVGLFGSTAKRKWSMFGLLLLNTIVSFVTFCLIVAIAIGKS